MLNNLTLTNFRKHQNLSVDFTPGMNEREIETVKGLME